MNEFSKLVEYDIVALQETWLKSKTIISYKGYTIFRNDRANDLGNGDGTAILCRSSLDSSLVNLNLSNKGVEFTVAVNKIIFNNKKLLVLSTYRLP